MSKLPADYHEQRGCYSCAHCHMWTSDAWVCVRGRRGKLPETNYWDLRTFGAYQQRYAAWSRWRLTHTVSPAGVCKYWREDA
jgi:hypothetical protein